MCEAPLKQWARTSRVCGSEHRLTTLGEESEDGKRGSHNNVFAGLSGRSCCDF